MQELTVIGHTTRNFEHDNYELIKLIGQGGFCSVYQARQVSTQKLVAIKFLDLIPNLHQKEKSKKIERFERETNLCAKLHHPNIVSLLDKGFTENSIFAVYDYIPGNTLKDEIAERGALPAPEAAELMGQVLDALTCAHSHGIVHRDLKPANIMITTTGVRKQIKLLDFGIAAFTPQARGNEYKNLTLTHESIGTPAYSAPEQLRGELPSSKTDIYSWGLLFIECLTGTPAMTGSSVASVFAKQLSPSNVVVPAPIAGHPLGELLRKVLSKKVDNRLGRADQIYKTLKAINIQTLVGNLNQQYSPLFKQASYNLNSDGNKTLLDTQHSTIKDNIQRKLITTLCVSIYFEVINKNMVDAEVIDTLHQDLKNQCVDISARYGGFYAGGLGDTLLIYYGYPVASDNDCRLGARTALEIISCMQIRQKALKQHHGVKINIHMGIHSGNVNIYSDEMPEGHTPNTAMKLARLARPNQILCSEATSKLLENHGEFEIYGQQRLGLENRKSTLFLLTKERQGEAFSFLRKLDDNHKLIGREEDLSTLLIGIDRIKQNTPKTFYIYGEAGIGKSRLLFEVRKRTREFTQYVAQCLPEKKYSALSPIFEIIRLKYSLDWLAKSDIDDCVTKIFKLHMEGEDLEKARLVLYSWLNITPLTHSSITHLSPGEQKTLVFKALSALLDNPKNDNQKDIYIIEDIHWADHVTIGFIKYFCSREQFSKSSQCIICTSRKPKPSEWDNLPFTAIKLNSLSNEQAIKYVKQLLEHPKISTAALNRIIERTDGIPLFMEEFVTMLRNKQLIHTVNGILTLTNPNNLDDIPGTLKESLQDKLETLTQAKETAQLAATIGREFELSLIAEVSSLSIEKVLDDLGQLVEANFIYKKRQVTGDSYIFKHALVRDAVYDSMANKQRISNHQRLANVFKERKDIDPSLDAADISRHFSGALMYDEAVHFGISKIESLCNTGLNSEVLHFSELIMKWIENIQNDNQREVFELTLYDHIISSEISTNSYSSKRALSWVPRIQQIISSMDKASRIKHGQLCRSITNKTSALKFLDLYYKSNFKNAKQLGVTLSEQYQDKNPEKLLLVQSFLAQIYQLEGNFDKAINAFEKTLTLFDPLKHKDIFIESDSDFLPYCKAMMSLSYLHKNSVDKALYLAKESVNLSIPGKYHVSCVVANIFYALHLAFCNNEKELINVCDNYFKHHYSEENRPYFIFLLEILYLTATGELDEAKSIVIEKYSSDNYFSLGWYAHFVARKLLQHSRIDEAVELMRLSLEKADGTTESATIPIIKNALALSLYYKQKKVTQEIQQLLTESIDISAQQGAHFFKEEAHRYLNLIQQETDATINSLSLFNGRPTNN